MAKAGKAASKATTTKKTVKKPTTVTKRATTKKKASAAAAESSFFEVRFTDQSVYWIIFGAAAIIFALWLFTIDARIRDLYDQIDANMYNADSLNYIPEQKPTQD